MADREITNRIINRARVLGYDFGTVLDDLRANLASLFGVQFNDFLGDPATVLLDTIAYALDSLFFYLDRRTSEGFLDPAVQRNSVSMLTRLVGYKMRSAIPASVDLRWELLQTYAFPVTVPRGFQIATDAGIVYEVAEEQTFAPGDGPKVIPAYQGETLSERFVGTGEPLQLVRLRRFPADTSPAAGNVRVTVDGVPWVESEFLTYDRTDQFEARFTLDPPQVLFGDGDAGNIPPQGSEIVVTYVATKGIAGNVGAGTIRNLVQPLRANFQTIRVAVTNPAKATGGDDPETLASAKAFAGGLFKSRKVAVTESDYNALAGQFADPVAGAVAVARAVSARTPSADAVLESALAILTSTATAFRPTVAAALTSARSALTSIDAQLDVQAAALASAASSNVLSDGTLQAAIVTARGSKNRATEIETDAADIQGLAVQAKTLIDTIADAATDGLTPATKAALKGYLDNIIGESGQVSSAAAGVRSNADGEITAMTAVRTALTETVGTSLASPGLLRTADQARQSIDASVGTETPATGIWANLATIDTVVVDIGATVAEQADIIRNHVAGFLAADCKANLISVLILARDEGRFYAAPSGALIRALQRYLDERRALEQVVEVSSGALFLVPAVIVATAGVRPGTVAESVVRAGLVVAIENVLRDRAFGAPLYLQELYDAARVVSGIRFVNIEIRGHYDYTNTLDTSKLDAKGNLLILDTEVITRGLITVEVSSTTK